MTEITGGGNAYLEAYRRYLDQDLSKGLGGFLRRVLDRRAHKQRQVNRHALFMPRLLAMAGKSLETPLTVLEGGCANGWAISFQHPHVRYIAVDRGTVYKEALESRGVLFTEGDLTKDPLPAATHTVDVVILSHLIEHLSDIDFFMSEAKRVLKQGGLLYIRTPNVAKVRWSFYDDYTHVRPFTPHGLDHLMGAYGFERKFLLHSDQPRISLDLLTGGLFRRVLFSRLIGGREIEAGYARIDNG